MSIDGVHSQPAPPHVPPHETSDAATSFPPILTAAPATNRWQRLDTYILLAAMLCASLVYGIRLGQPAQYIWDEVYHAYTAAVLVTGNPDPYNPFAKVPEADKQNRGAVTYEWTHPAFAKLPMQLGILLFGDNPVGWRVMSALFGVIGVGVMYAFARRMFDQPVAVLATSLLILDGLWFAEARLAMNDIFLLCFLLLGYFAFYRYLSVPYSKRWRYLWLTGFALGFGVATKWSALYSIGLLGAVAAAREGWIGWRLLRSNRRAALGSLLGGAATLAAGFLLLPAAIYLAAYVQFFAMGRTWADWRELQYQMWWYHSNLRACHNYASPWWSWPLLLRPVWFYLYIMGNPLSWWLYLPAVLFVGYLWVTNRFRSPAFAVVLLGYFGQWLPWALSPRVAYLYHMLPTVPFACLALGYALNRFRLEFGLLGRRMVIGYMAVVALSFAFFYPLWTDQKSVLAAPVLPGSVIGQDTPVTYGQLHFWLPTWAAGTAWDYKCPQSSFTLLDLVPRLRTK